MSLKEKLKKANKKSKASESVGKLKLQTLLNPTDPKGWFMLSESLFKLGKNKSGWKCLTTAKKLGSVDAMVKIDQILSSYGEKGNKARALVSGEEL